MFSWKERLYALLLRRILGPLLSNESQQKLYTRIQQISVTDGSYIFNDVSFNTEYISSQFLNHAVHLVTATIRTIQIDIRLVEEFIDSSTTTDDTTGIRQLPSSSSLLSAPSTTTTSNSLAWRALKFGINTASNATAASIEKNGATNPQPTPQQRQKQCTVSLVVHVRLEGINIVIEPAIVIPKSTKNTFDMEASKMCQNDTAVPRTTTTTESTTTTAATYLSSYVEAILASLRFSIELHDIRIRLRNNSSRTTGSSTKLQQQQQRHETPASYTHNFIEFHTQSIIYHDMLKNNIISNNSNSNSRRPVAAVTSPIESQSAAAGSYETIMNKVLDVTRITVLTGSGSDLFSDPVSTNSTTFVVALLDGTSRACIRIVEYINDRTQSNPNKDAATASQVPPLTQQEIQVSLHQKVNISFDIVSLQLFRAVINCFLTDPRADEPDIPLAESVSVRRSSQSSAIASPNESFGGDEGEAMDDDADYRTLESIMAQYREVRLLIEKKEIRGGLLLQSLDDNGQVTYDAFFDANESSSSLQRHSSMLKESLFGSMMYTNNKQHKPSSDWIYRKFTFHLQEGGIKLTFPSPDDTNMKQYAAKEYVLLTFNDIHISSQQSLRSNKYAFSVQHVEIEDAIFVHDVSACNDILPATEIGTMVRFVPDGDCHDIDDDDDDSNLLVLAPCLSMLVNTNNDDINDTMDVDVVMGPIEISYRHHMITKLIQFFQVDTINNPPVLDKPKHTTITVNAACTSLTLLLPLPVYKDVGPIYDRAGYVSESTMVRESAFGLVCDRVVCELRKSDSGDQVNEYMVSCHQIIGFVTSPISRYNAFDNRIQRLDFFAVCGRTEVDPCIPICIRCTHFPRSESSYEIMNGDIVLAESLFPKVPFLSSFKVRQEDDDNDTQSNIEAMGLKLNDPQSAMLLDLMNTDVVVSLHIPEIFVDLSAPEIIAIQNLANYFHSRSSPQATVNPIVQDGSIRLRTACSVKCESIRLSFHVENTLSCIDSSYDNSIFALSMEAVKCHCVLNGTAAKHLRVLVHDFDFIEISKIVQDDGYMEPTSVSDRKRLLRRRSSCRDDSIANPILHRSYLFIPISPASPSIHLDFLLPSEESQDTTTTFYMNLFHVSYRHHYDCSWIKRLCSVLPPNTTAEKTIIPASMMRIFMSGTDCNLDYVSPEKFHTASRLIIRIGEMRLSSNLVTPRPSKQAFACSVTEIAVLLCCSRFPYNFENGRLISSAEVMKPVTFAMHSLNLHDEAESDDVLRSMNYRSMLTIESISLNVILSARELETSEPAIFITISTRQICVFGCRDSLARLSDTIGEATAELTAITTKSFEDLKSKSLKCQTSGTLHASSTGSALPLRQNLNNDVKSSWCQSNATSISADLPREFNLDGYDWTAIDSDEIGKPGIPQGEEQSARWFVDADNGAHISNSIDGEISIVQNNSQFNAMKAPSTRKVPPIITHHFNLHPVLDPIGDGDMGAPTYANAKNDPKVQARLIIRDLAIRLRFFDGYDWPELLNEKARSAPRSEFFVIPEAKKKSDDDGSTNPVSPLSREAEDNKKSKLLDDLLNDGVQSGNTFANIPLPDEHESRMKEQSEIRRLARRTSKYFQIEASGVSARLDSIEESDEHRLVSCLNIMVNDLFLAESISSDKPVKMLGEWFNEQEHPRDSKEGLVLMKMVTWHPLNRITPDDEVANDESDVCLKVHPLRCIIDQRAVEFIRAFFNSDNDHGADHVLPPQLHAVPPPLFTMFRVQPLKLKVDYRPQKLDTSALRNGSVVELINLSPLDGMMLTLKEVHVENEVGFGPVMSLVVRLWVEDICATQLHKFVTKSRPFEPITEVGAAATDMAILPWEAFRNGESVSKALKAGARSFSKVAVYEFLNTSSRAANFVGTNISRITEAVSTGNSLAHRSGSSLLPDRPVHVPKSLSETGTHALESLSRGLQEANYIIVIVPYREYHRSGATGAAFSVIRGIPVAIAAPTSGAAEALSYTLLGIRNQIRPDIRKEDEVSFRGLYPS